MGKHTHTPHKLFLVPNDSLVFHLKIWPEKNLFQYWVMQATPEGAEINALDLQGHVGKKHHHFKENLSKTSIRFLEVF